MKKQLTITFGIVFIGILAFVSVHVLFREEAKDEILSAIQFGEIVIHDVVVQVEIADTPRKRARGLSGREKLLPHTGMLFFFEEGGMYGFWMKEMQFPIDILWFDENLHVVDLDVRVSPNSFPHIFYPSEPTWYVLEVEGGFAERLGIKIGDQAVFSPESSIYR